MPHLCRREVVDEATGKTVDFMRPGLPCYDGPCISRVSDVVDDAALDTSDLRLELRVKNNLLYKAIQSKYPSVLKMSEAAAAKGASVSYGYVCALLNFKVSPKGSGDFDQNPEYTKRARDLADFLGLPPEYLLPDELYQGISVSKRVIEVSSKLMLANGHERTLRALPAPEEESPEEVAKNGERHELLMAVLATLPFKERGVIELRYGIKSPINPDAEVHSRTETGRVFKVSPSRVGQIEAKAVRKLQNPMRARRLEPLVLERPECRHCHDEGVVLVSCEKLPCPNVRKYCEKSPHRVACSHCT